MRDRRSGAPGCPRCGDTGEIDPFDAHDGSPLFTDCRDCLGVGVEGCLPCDGLGAVPVPVECPGCSHGMETVTHERAA